MIILVVTSVSRRLQRQVRFRSPKVHKIKRYIGPHRLIAWPIRSPITATIQARAVGVISTTTTTTTSTTTATTVTTDNRTRCHSVIQLVIPKIETVIQTIKSASMNRISTIRPTETVKSPSSPNSCERKRPPNYVKIDTVPIDNLNRNISSTIVHQTPIKAQ